MWQLSVNTKGVMKLKVKQVKVTNYVKDKSYVREMTDKQLDALMRMKAETSAPLDVKVIKEREL